MFRTAALAICIAALPAAALAQHGVDTRSKLMLSATGETTVAPDLAYVSAGVVSQAQSASAALSDNAAKMNRVFSELRGAGVAESDIQTSNLSVSPVYANDRDNREDGPRIIAYRANNQVSVTLRDLDRVGAAIDALVEAGANNVRHGGFGREDSDAAKDAARRAAMEKLLEKASLYAEAGGFELGPIYELSETQDYRSGRVMAMAARMESADSAPSPVAPGELDISVTVNATFGIQY